MNKADTCRKYVMPKLVQAGWGNEPHFFLRGKKYSDPDSHFKLVRDPEAIVDKALGAV